MTTDQVYLNEIRTLQGELASAQENERSSRIRLLNAAMRHEQNLTDLKTELKKTQGALESLRRKKEKQNPAAKSDDTIIKQFTDRAISNALRIGTAATKIGVNVAIGPDFFYGSQHHKDVRVLERIAMKNASTAARDVIARSASNLLLDAKDVLRIARAAESGLMDEASLRPYQNWLPRSLLSLARVIADQDLLPTDSRDAVALYKLASQLWTEKIFDTRSILIFTDLLDNQERYEELDNFCRRNQFSTKHSIQYALYMANRQMRTGQPSASWLENLNAELIDQGLSPIESDGQAEDVLSGLRVSAPSITEGPLVTIMMPTHNGSKYILTAIQSVLAQTWQNIELIVVDDHSDEEHWQRLVEVAPHDERLKIIRLDANQGAYRARLRALEAARGEFVTVHDDDDWSHPQKIETQVRHLLSHDDVIANMSCMTRIDQHALFVRINDNPEFNQKNYSSMMIRKSDVMRLGAWDDLNRAADAEFHDRIYAATGNRVQFVDTPPMSFMRARTGSLTSGEIRKGALDFGRQTYGLLYSGWHLKIKEIGNNDKHRAVDFKPVSRPFPVPANFMPGNRAPKYARFDVIYCTDYRFPGGNSTLTNAELRAAHFAGKKVAVLHLDSPVLRAPHPFNPEIASSILELDIPVVSMEDVIDTRLLIVRNPTILQFTENLKTNISTEKLVLIANTAPMSINGRDACYDMKTCAENAQHCFGADALLIPESPQTRSLIQALSPDLELSNFNWPGFIDDSVITEGAREPGKSKPIVGRHSRDHRLKWPDNPSDIRAAYIGDGKFDTEILGGAASIVEVVDLPTHGVVIHPFGSVDPKDFLQGVDFWVYMHSDQLVESFGMAILEAMAAGCVIILPHYMRKLFGDAALYGNPEDVPAIVDEYWNNSGEYRTQSGRAVKAARENFSSSAYLKRLQRISDIGCHMEHEASL